MIVFDNAFPKTRNELLLSQVITASTGMRPPGGEGWGGGIQKELHTIRQDGTDGGARDECEPAQTRLSGWNEQACFWCG